MSQLIPALQAHLTHVISGTNGITLEDTLELAAHKSYQVNRPQAYSSLCDFRNLLWRYQQDIVDDVRHLVDHPVGQALFNFFRAFPLRFREEHIHLTGSLTPEFIYPRLQAILDGPNGAEVAAKIRAVYGQDSLPLRSEDDVRRLVALEDDEEFDRYLQILLLPKLILIDRQSHDEAAYDLARNLYTRHNIGFVRLKFTLSRASADGVETGPSATVDARDVVLGLYEGFARFRREHPDFDFVLSPSFRKEATFFDANRFPSKRDDFMHHVKFLLTMIADFPELERHLCDVDTVGNERNMYRKQDFLDLKPGFDILQQHGFRIRSHHGENWHVLRYGIQAVDNALNIWQIDSLEHGLSLGINPNVYFYRLMQNVMEGNGIGRPPAKGGWEERELSDLDWGDSQSVLTKLLRGQRLTAAEFRTFDRARFQAATEVEHYQHDVLNHVITKGVLLTSLPSSNKRLTTVFPDFKDHPFSYWEKKRVRQAVGTDNYVTLSTNFIREMIILLLSDARDLKITKLLMVTTNERRRPYISRLLWTMREHDST